MSVAKSLVDAAPMTFDWCSAALTSSTQWCPPPITSQSHPRKISQEQSRGRWGSSGRFCNLLLPSLFSSVLFHLSCLPSGWSCQCRKGIFINVESCIEDILLVRRVLSCCPWEGHPSILHCQSFWLGLESKLKLHFYLHFQSWKWTNLTMTLEKIFVIVKHWNLEVI